MKGKNIVLLLMLLALSCSPVSSHIIPNFEFIASSADSTTNNLIQEHIVESPRSVSESPYPRVRCGYAGSAGSLIINWQELAGNISDFSTSLYHKKYLPKLKWLHQQGINLTINIDWRVRQDLKPNPLDFYYNQSFRALVFEMIDNIFSDIPQELVSTIVIGDEEPNGAYQWFNFIGEWPYEIVKYNNTYHDETGYWFKDIDKMNNTERLVWEQWMEERNTYTYNSIYNYTKNSYPDKAVVLAIMENYHIGFNPAAILTDERSGYQFYTKDPRKVYAAVRFAKTAYPDTPVSTVLWGTNPYIFYEEYTLKDFERLAYAAYIAGADKISWFTLGEDEHKRSLLAWQRIDDEGRKIFDFLNSLNRELMELPVFRGAPKILEIADYDSAGNSEGIGFVEWDNTNQIFASASTFNLSKYNLVVIKDQASLLPELVEKINKYVESGGNLIVVGSTGSSGTDPFGNPRPSLIYEEATSDYAYFYNPINVTLDGNNVLGIVADTPLINEQRISIKYTSNGNYDFISTGATEEKSGYYPLMLYHNDSNPSSGFVLYYGFPVSWETELLSVWFSTLQAFANYIKFSEGIATEDTAKMLVSIAEFPEEERYIVGFINDETERDFFGYNFNFTIRNLTERELWIYQHDKVLEWGDILSFYNHQTTIAIAPFKKEDAVLFELLPPWPKGRLIVNTYPLRKTPVVGEAFTIHGDVRNIMRYTQVHAVNATITLPDKISLTSYSNPQKIELGRVYSEVRSGFGYPIGFSWHLQASEPGNYTFKITVEGLGLDPIIKYLIVEVKTNTVDVTFARENIFATPNESFYWKVGVKLRGNGTLHNVKIEVYLPYSDWYAPHQEQTIETLEAGETVELTFTYNQWFEKVPYWALPGERIVFICTPLVDGYVQDDIVGFVNVVSSKVQIYSPEKLETSVGTTSLSIQLQALGIDYARDVKIEIIPSSGITLLNSTLILIGTLSPSETQNLTLTFEAEASGTYKIELILHSSNAYVEPIVISIIIQAKKGLTAEIGTLIGTGLTGVLVGAGIVSAIYVLLPKLRAKRVEK